MKIALYINIITQKVNFLFIKPMFISFKSVMNLLNGRRIQAFPKRTVLHLRQSPVPMPWAVGLDTRLFGPVFKRKHVEKQVEQYNKID